MKVTTNSRFGVEWLYEDSTVVQSVSGRLYDGVNHGGMGDT